MENRRRHLLLRKQQSIAKLLILQKIRSTQNRRFWVREIFRERESFGDYHSLIPKLRDHVTESFRNYLRFTPSQLEDILCTVGPLLQKRDTHFRKAIPPAEKLTLTMRFLASGESMRSMSYQFRLGYSTTSMIISETCAALWTSLSPIFMEAPTNSSSWKEIAHGFKKKWHFPHCVGAIDGKHVIIQAPDNSGTLYYNYKNMHSIVIMAACNIDYAFTLLSVGDFGHHSDGGVLANSSFGKAMLENKLNLPPSENLPESNISVPYVFVADEAFALKTYMMRPYSAQNLNVKRRIFNYRLCRARRVIENTYGILAARWRILRKPILAKVTTVENIVKAACILHNYIMKNKKDFTGDEENSQGEIIHGTWRNENVEQVFWRQLERGRRNNYSQNAANVRDTFADYFDSPLGSSQVPWQYSKVHRGCF